MPVLTSNNVEIPFDDAHFGPMVDSTDLLGDPDALRSRFAADGYLYLRGLLHPERIRRLRAQYFGAFDAGYLRSGVPAEAGVFSGTRPDALPAHGTPGHPAHAFVRSPSFAALVADPALVAVASTVLGGPSTVLPRQIVRQFDRATNWASRAHRDVAYLDRGSDRLVTMWIPLTDVPLATGGLIYLERSADLDAAALDALRQVTDRPDDTRPLSHDLAWVSEQLARRWLWTDYRAGDVTVHSPWLVHASLDNTTDAMRLSADVRFVLDGCPVDPRWTQPWSGDDGY
jgi:hypothetical protein